MKTHEIKKATMALPPAYFTPKTRGLWTAILQEYVLEAEALETLRIACENLDLADQARALLRKEGLIVEGKRNPASDAVKLHDGLYLRCMRQLGLDVVMNAQEAGKRA